MRTLLPEFFGNRDPFLPDVQAVLQNGTILPLPKTKDMTGPRIVFFRWQGSDPDVVTLISIAKVYFMLMDVLMAEDDNCMVAGIYLLADYKDFKTNYILQFTPSLMKKGMLCLQNAYPIRIKGMYLCKAPTIFETVFNMLRSVLNEKLQKRMALYSEKNYEKVYKHIPQALLPQEYGGSNGSVKELTVEWKKKIESYKDWFIEDEKYCTYEHLRYGKPYTTADVFGVEGTFRKLSID